MREAGIMSSPLKKQPELVADKVLRRAELGKMARKLQNRLALAQFKTRHGWEDLTLDSIEPKVEEELRRKRLHHPRRGGGHDGGDMLSDSSSSASDLPYPSGRALMSSPLKAPFFSDAPAGSSGAASTGHRKRTYTASLDAHPPAPSSPSKRLRASPAAHRSLSGHASWKDHHQLAQSSPIKPRRQQHFTTSTGPDVSLFQGTGRLAESLASPNFAAPDDDDDDLLPAHSFQAPGARRSSPPSTPPMRSRGLRRSGDAAGGDAAGAGGPGSGGPGPKTGEEGADLLLYLAASPSPAHPPVRTRMEPPSTPPPRKMDLPSSMMTTPGGGNLFPATPGQAFDFADFVNITPSPAQKPWKTPIALGGPAKTPRSVARRRLTFDEPPLPC